jgi:hypothetical protein
MKPTAKFEDCLRYIGVLIKRLHIIYDWFERNLPLQRCHEIEDTFETILLDGIFNIENKR